LLVQQNTLLHEIKERSDLLYRENEYLQNRLARFGA